MSTIELAAIRKTVHVRCGAERAFELFTRDIGTWWPIATHSLAGEAVTELVFEQREGGAVYELAPGGRGEWARVTRWEPPARVTLEWLIGGAHGTTVDVTFTPEGDGTRVELVHDGFDSSASHASYVGGWDVVLAPFVDAAR